MREEIARDFQGFKAIDESGTLIGPFNVWLRAPKWGRPIWEFMKAMSVAPTLPRPVREVAILVTGAHFRAAYEIYAHVLLAERRGLDDDKLAAIVAGQRPSNLTLEEGIAYDVASALVSGHVLPALTYRRAVSAFGEASTMELIYLAGPTASSRLRSTDLTSAYLRKIQCSLMNSALSARATIEGPA